MGKDSAPAPLPDPAIGQAAMMQGELGQQWLDFSKQQFATGQDRQVAEDAMVKQVIDSQMSSQDKANLWAQQDRDTQAQYRTKYDAWADEDRAAGKAAQSDYAGYAKDALATGDKYEGKLNGIADSFGKGADEQNAFAKAQRDRYTSTFQPIEDKLASDAMGWDSAERQSSEAAKAKAGVISEAAMADQASQRQMASMGVNPNSGRFAGQGRANSLNTALASAGAQNIARDNVQQQGISLRGQAVGVGQNVVGNANTATSLGMQQKSQQQGASQAAYGTQAAGQSQAMQATTGGLAAAGVGNTAAQLGLGQQGAGYTGLGVGVGAGSAAVGSQGAANSNFYQNNGVMSQGFSGGMQGAAGQASTLNSQYANQLNGWGMQQQANASSSAGLGSMIGTLGGAAIKAGMFSSKEYKTDKRPVDGALDAINKMPVEAWKYKDGIADGGEHIGAYAEDFQAATGKGDGKTIPIVDAIGVTMKAVQELDKKIDAQGRKGAKR